MRRAAAWAGRYGRLMIVAGLVAAVLAAPGAPAATIEPSSAAQDCPPPACKQIVVERAYRIRMSGTITTVFPHDGITATSRWTATYPRLRLRFRQRTDRVGSPPQTLTTFTLETVGWRPQAANGSVVDSASLRSADGCQGSTRASSPATANVVAYGSPYNESRFSLETYRERANHPVCKGTSWSPEGVEVRKPGRLLVGFGSGVASLHWRYRRPPRLGRLPFPLDRLYAGKKVAVSATGRSTFNGHPSNGSVQIVFLPR